MVQEPGKPEQWLSEVDVPGAWTGENYYGYEKLPLTTVANSAAVFSTNSYQNLVSQAHISGTTGLTTVYAAVRLTALGDSNVQMYPSYHLNGYPLGSPNAVGDHVVDMNNYTISVNSQCQIALQVLGANLVSGIAYLVLCSTKLKLLTTFQIVVELSQF
jgi:hypothetical protein